MCLRLFIMYMRFALFFLVLFLDYCILQTGLVAIFTSRREIVDNNEFSISPCTVELKSNVLVNIPSKPTGIS